MKVFLGKLNCRCHCVCWLPSLIIAVLEVIFSGNYPKYAGVLLALAVVSTVVSYYQFVCIQRQIVLLERRILYMEGQTLK